MEKFFTKRILLLFLSFTPIQGFSWGFFAHEHINRLAVFTLPAEMAGFYKEHLEFITEAAVLPDKRRYVVKNEGPRHFIDLDIYEDSSGITLPQDWKRAVEKYGEDSLMKHGVLPWHLYLMKYELTQAFKNKNPDAILKLSAEIGHYLGDAHVPLHTCSNYNGQFTNQHGIHGLWESRLPELYFESFDFFVGPAMYISNTREEFWSVVFRSQTMVDSVLKFEKSLSEEFSSDLKYSFEERGGTMVRTYSKDFCNTYHLMLAGQVERQMRASVKMIGNIWYTCWVDAGQPDLKDLMKHHLKEEDINEIKQHDDKKDGCVH
ncbi:MAG: hypothetical protein K2X86_11435 [Cytophagaceae bacterium]|nr:hypothetical protein [Cytophagaceae bacterium]